MQKREGFVEEGGKVCLYWENHYIAWNKIQSSGIRDLTIFLRKMKFQSCSYDNLVYGVLVFICRRSPYS